jgi:hypothetical protein
MPVGSNDILTSDGKWTYLRSQKIGPDGKRVEIGPVSGNVVEQASAQKGEGSHLFAPMGFLDEAWFHRSYWVFGKNFAGGAGGYYQAGKYTPSGRILVFDKEKVYGYGREPQYFRWTTPMQYQLFSASRNAPDVDPQERQGKGGGGKRKAGRKNAASSPGSTNSLSDPGGFFVKYDWTNHVPVTTRAMSMAGKEVVVSGTPNMINEEETFAKLMEKDPAIQETLKEQDAAIHGQRGGSVKLVGKEDGQVGRELPLKSAPVWDGMAVARGHLYIVTEDGKIQCYGQPVKP